MENKMTGILIGAVLGAAVAIITRKPEAKPIPIKIKKEKRKN